MPIAAASRLPWIFLALTSCAYDWEVPHDGGTTGDACATPTCEPVGLRDAGTSTSPHDGEPDEDGEPASPLPALLPGTYALRVQSYGRDGEAGTRLSQQGIMIADISGDPAARTLEMSVRFCEVRAEALPRLGPKVLVRTAFPERLPRRLFTVALRDGTFHTEGPPLVVGYTQEPPEGCVPGMQLTRADPWRSSCTCPKQSDVPPTSSSDCRVVDADGDGEPGLTMLVAASNIQSRNHLRTKDMSQLVAGTIAPDRHHTAHYVQSEETFNLKCANTYCAASTVASCAEALNRAMFAPLDETGPSGGAWTCAEVVAQIEANKLLPVSPLVFPSDC